MARSKVLVTGVAGFIGSHVAEHCLRAGCDVVGVDDLSGGFRRSVPARVRFTVGDLRDPQVIEKLRRDEGSFDVVYHLAAYAAEGLSPGNGTAKAVRRPGDRPSSGRNVWMNSP